MPSCWQEAADGGMQVLANAAIPKEVQEVLAPRMTDNHDEFQKLLVALASPPSSVCVRCTSTDWMAKEQDDAKDLELCIRRGLIENEPSAHFSFQMKEAPFPFSCPEARIIVGQRGNPANGSKGYADTTVDSADLADFIIDATCAMAVLRGADVFCMGVMAASPRLLEGQRVRLWVVPEGVRPPNRGSILAESPSKFPAVLVAGGQVLLPRSAIFASALQGQKGAAVKVMWRRGQVAPLAPMNQVLANADLQGKILLQQLPSCLCTRVLNPCPGHLVLDMCAAPGGKTTHIAQLLGAGGLGLTAVDRSLAKLRRIEALCLAHHLERVRCLAADARHLCGEKAQAAEASEATAQVPCERCEVSNEVDEAWPAEAEKAFQEAVTQHGADRFRSSKRIWKAVIAAVGRGPVTRMQVNARLRTVEGQLSQPHDAGGPPGPPFEAKSFDRILLDPPCSAMGQRPLLRWGKSISEVESHADYQRQFLHTASKLLKEGGEMVYSTCTLTPQENEENVAWALETLPLRLLDSRENVLQGESSQVVCLTGLPNCGLNDGQREMVLRFDPRTWDAGFFIARFRKLKDQS